MNSQSFPLHRSCDLGLKAGAVLKSAFRADVHAYHSSIFMLSVWTLFHLASRRSLSYLLTLSTLCLSLPLPLGVNFTGEWILEGQGDLVYQEDKHRQGNACWLAQPERTAKETHEAAVVHRCVRHVEREAGYHFVHEDTKVVAEIGTSNTKSPHGREDEGIAASEKSDGESICERGLKERMTGLGA